MVKLLLHVAITILVEIGLVVHKHDGVPYRRIPEGGGHRRLVRRHRLLRPLLQSHHLHRDHGLQDRKQGINFQRRRSDN